MSKTDRREAEKEGSPWWMFAGSCAELPLPINKTTQELTDAQEGRCPISKGLLFGVEDRPQTPREWEKRLATRTTATIATTRATGNTEEAEPRLAHAACRHGTGLALHTAHEPSGLA